MGEVVTNNRAADAVQPSSRHRRIETTGRVYDSRPRRSAPSDINLAETAPMPIAPVQPNKFARSISRRILRQWALAQFLTIALVAVGGFSATAAPPEADLAKALEALRYSNDEWRREDAAFRSSRATSRLSKSELEDYAAFVANLRLRLLRRCEAVRKMAGDDATKGFDCVSPALLKPAYPAVPPSTSVQTDEEKKASLNARLNNLEAEIDEALLKRQRDLQQSASNKNSRNAKTSSSSASSASQSGSASATASTGERGGGSAGPTAAESATAQKTNAGGSTSKMDGATAVSNEKGGAPRREARDAGTDDDIIARQLREAAEKETDPILKEKLWVEYKRYKDSQ